ncbi:TPA: hypothetical protein ACU8BF_000956 [Neisseria subflava]
MMGVLKVLSDTSIQPTLAAMWATACCVRTAHTLHVGFKVCAARR